jgi:SH3-like domain-containing protein
LAALINEYLVEILPETAVVDGVTWSHIRTTEGIEGWVLQSVLAMATPVPTTIP